MRRFLFSGLVLCAMASTEPAMGKPNGSETDGRDDEKPTARLTAAGAVAASVFPAYDANGDGRITRREFDRQLDRVFRTWDGDNDTYLMPDDLPTPALRVLADKNRDGLVTYTEYLPKMLMLRNAMDDNGDRTVSAAEWRAYVESEMATPEKDSGGT